MRRGNGWFDLLCVQCSCHFSPSSDCLQVREQPPNITGGKGEKEREREREREEREGGEGKGGRAAERKRSGEREGE